MAETTRLNALRAALSVVSARAAGVVEPLPDTVVPIPGSSWTVREAAVHLAMVGFHYAGMVHGEPNQYPSLARQECARLNDQLNADIPESDPGKLAALMREGTERLLAATAPCRDTQEVLFHCGSVTTILHLGSRPVSASRSASSTASTASNRRISGRWPARSGPIPSPSCSSARDG